MRGKAVEAAAEAAGGHQREVRQRAVETIKTAYDAREEKFTLDVMRHLERVITLQSIDAHWKDHLLAMDHLKDGIGLRGYGQRNPLQEYQREGYDMFVDMLGRFEADVVEKMYSVQIAAEQDVDRIEEIRRRRHQQMMAAQVASRRVEEAPATVVKREADKVGRNDPCPCGSGKKYKKCHGTA